MLRRRIIMGLCGAWCVIAAPVAAAPPDGYVQTWADEFNGVALDTTKWNYRQLGPRRDAVNVANAVSVGDGNLAITTYTDAGVHYTGMIGTQGLFQQAYGYWEARVQFAGSPGMWSAYWLQSPTMGSPIGNPAVAGTEIDIQEHRSIYPTRVHNAVHWDGYGASHQSQSADTTKAALGDGGYHLYGLEWTPSAYRFYFDGQPVWTFTTAISQRSQYIILSSEVQNASWAGNIPVGGYGSLATSTTRMNVDYVRVYATPEPASAALLGLGAAVTLFRRRRRR